MTEMTPLHREFLIACADDWCGPWLLARDIQRHDPKADGSTVQARALTILRDLLGYGYIQAGDLVDFKNDRFIPWDLSVAQIVERIRVEWNALGRDPNPDNAQDSCSRLEDRMDQDDPE